MGVDWTDNFICSICKTSKKVVKELERGIDPDTKNPFRIIEMECGHTEKATRITKELMLPWKIRKGEEVRVEPFVDNGKPSVAVSSGSHTTIVAGGVKIDLGEAKNVIMNFTNVEENSNFVQNISWTQFNITYNEILEEIDKQIPDESEKEEIKKIVEDIKNDINSKRIPHSNLEKLKGIEKIYNIVYPWAMKGIELYMKYGSF